MCGPASHRCRTSASCRAETPTSVVFQADRQEFGSEDGGLAKAGCSRLIAFHLRVLPW